jgi:hypothetical protein
MSKYVAIKDVANGNESVGEMWQETLICDADTTVQEIMDWAMQGFIEQGYSMRRVTLTKAREVK